MPGGLILGYLQYNDVINSVWFQSHLVDMSVHFEFVISSIKDYIHRLRGPRCFTGPIAYTSRRKTIPVVET